MNYNEILDTLIKSDKKASGLYLNEGKHIYDVYGVYCHASDGARASGVLFGIKMGALYSLETQNNQEIENECIRFHINSRKGVKYGNIISGDGTNMVIDGYSYLSWAKTDRKHGYRPCLPYSLIKDILVDKKKVARSFFGNVIYEAILPTNELGDEVDVEKQEILNQLLKDGELKQVDSYPMDANLISETTKEFDLIEYPIYEDSNGNKYIRLPNQKYRETDDYHWYNIENPKVFYDPNTDFAIFKKVAVGGIRVCDLDNYKIKYWLPRMARQIEIAYKKYKEKNPEHQELDYETMLANISREFNGHIDSMVRYIKNNFDENTSKKLLEELDFKLSYPRNYGLMNGFTSSQYANGGRSRR